MYALYLIKLCRNTVQMVNMFDHRRSWILLSVLCICVTFVVVTNMMSSTRFSTDELMAQLKNKYGRMKSNRTRVMSPPHGTQMGQTQIDKIKSALPKHGNLLVWGLGNDSPFWHDSTEGIVIFLEEAGTSWFSTITNKYPFLEAYQVTYSTNLVSSFKRYCDHRENWNELDLRTRLPEIISTISWDVIIVDAPAGYTNSNPGRYEAIYTSSRLARSGTHIFVDDYNRKVERCMSDQILGTPLDVTPRSNNVQAHFVMK